jgi:hypothetical protein
MPRWSAVIVGWSTNATRPRHEHRLPLGASHTASQPETSGGFVMPNPNVVLIRQAYAAYAHGDTAAMLDLVDPDLA